jgi:hypothetical protein
MATGQCQGFGTKARHFRRQASANPRVMAVYTYSDGYSPLRPMSRKTQLTLTDRQHAYLAGESLRTGLSMAELVRRAIDKVYRPNLRPRVPGYELSVGLWKRPDAAIIGRRRERRLTDD